MRRGVFLAAAVAALVAGSVERAGGAPAATRVIDRTLECAVAGTGSPDVVRLMTVWGWNGNRAQRLAPQIGVVAAGDPDAVTAGVTTGPGSVPWTIARPGEARLSTGVAWISRLHCSRTAKRVPLSGSGLRASAGYNAYRCDVPARVLLRLRAVFRRPVTLSRDARRPWQLVAKGRIESGAVAVATTSGRRILFATAADAAGTGRAVADGRRCDPHGA